MKVLLVCLALVSVASIVDAQSYRGGYGRNGSHSAVVQQRRQMYRQPARNYGSYQPQRRLYQPMLYGYGYGPGIYSSADQPIINNHFYTVDPYSQW
jgi:hypothetical protein